MRVLPLFKAGEAAHDVMLGLHLNWSWLDLSRSAPSVVVSTICFVFSGPARPSSGVGESGFHCNLDTLTCICPALDVALSTAHRSDPCSAGFLRPGC